MAARSRYGKIALVEGLFAGQAARFQLRRVCLEPPLTRRTLVGWEARREGALAWQFAPSAEQALARAAHLKRDEGPWPEWISEAVLAARARC